MPIGLALEHAGCPQESFLLESGGFEMQADGKPAGSESTGDRNGRNTRQIGTDGCRGATKLRGKAKPFILRKTARDGIDTERDTMSLLPDVKVAKILHTPSFRLMAEG